MRALTAGALALLARIMAGEQGVLVQLVRIDLAVHLLREREAILARILRIEGEHAEAQALQLPDMDPPHAVILLVVDDRVPGENCHAACLQVLADDAQVLDVLDTEYQYRSVGRDGLQCLQVRLRKRAKARQPERQPCVRRLQQ